MTLIAARAPVTDTYRKFAARAPAAANQLHVADAF